MAKIIRDYKDYKRECRFLSKRGFNWYEVTDEIRDDLDYPSLNFIARVSVKPDIIFEFPVTGYHGSPFSEAHSLFTESYIDVITSVRRSAESYSKIDAIKRFYHNECR